MHRLQKIDRRWSLILIITTAVVMGWNYWLPTAENFYNLITPADENRQYALRNVDFFAYYNAGVRFEKAENPYFYSYQEGNVFSDYIYPPTLLPLIRSLVTWNMIKPAFSGLDYIFQHMRFVLQFY